MPNLIGTGNNQVPTNGMLGGLAYQSPDNAVIKTLELTNLSGHNSVIPSNAIDVFVYDTRKDSDGGQWRKRTQHTSWYNETLNTEIRGSRRDFPAVAVIVATTTTITIYDGDDPDMPMWIVIARNPGTLFLTDGYSCLISSITALNGIISVGIYATNEVGYYGGLITLNLVKDIGFKYGGNSIFYSGRGSYGTKLRDIVNPTWYQLFLSPSTFSLVSGYTNDVAMTVLPNAPIDSTTGLPVPTIVVATTSGVNIIKDDGTIISWLTTVGNVSRVSISKNYEIFAGGGGGIAFYAWYNKTIPTLSSNNSDAIFGTLYSSTSLPRLGSNGNSVVGDKSIFSNDTIYFSEYAGISTNDKLIILNQNTSHFGNSLVAYLTSSYNTGWMYGDIKGAFLSDTSTASVTGTELVTNGTFISDASGWTTTGVSSSVSSGRLRITNTTVTNGEVYQGFATQVGKKYVLTLECYSGTSNASFFISNAAPDNYLGDLGYVSPASGSYTMYFTASATTTYLRLENVNTPIGAYSEYDNISVRLVEPDRSVNNKGLAVYGTITKTPVATGSNLVAYSGWSNSNYSLRPAGVTDLNNSSMTFMSWYKGGSYAGEEVIVSTGDYGSASEVRSIYLTPSGVPGFAGWSNDYNPGNSIRDNTWHFICVVIQYVSGTTYNISVYVDGVLTGTTSKSLSTFTNTAINVGGGSIPGTYFANGSLSLVRVSTTIPSPEQIKKIYEDEKALFQSNSQATLFGSSDIVTALAYDDTTSLLHVGTSSGRSEFKGLKRVGNTTTAVTTSISASNGLVAEQ
jgi:hypothetical protein